MILLSEIPEDPEILPWLEKHHRDKDWVEQENIISQIVDEYDNQLGEFIYEERPDLLKFKNCDTKVKLEEWFTTRMFEIDETSRQVDISCDLIDLGIKRGLDNLKKYKNDLETLKILTYKINIDSPLTLKHFRELEELSKIRLLMSKTTDERFIKDYKLYLMPYLNKIKKPKERQKLLHEFIIDLARTDLTCCLKLFERCVPSVSTYIFYFVLQIKFGEAVFVRKSLINVEFLSFVFSSYPQSISRSIIQSVIQSVSQSVRPSIRPSVSQSVIQPQLLAKLVSLT